MALDNPLPVLAEPTPTVSTIEFPAKLRGKRVLLATESLGPVNGVSRTTQSLIQYLRDNEVQVAIVAPKFKGYVSYKTKNCKDPEVRVHGYPLPYNPDLTVAYPMRLDRIFERTFRPDLIYLASPASVGFQFLLQTRQLFSPPAVLLNFQTDLSSYGEIIFPKPLDDYAVWLLRNVQGFLFNHKAIHTIFYPSDFVRKYLDKAGAPAEKLVHLGRGVDTTLFDPVKRDEQYHEELTSNEEIVLMCCGRLAPEKGFKFLADAFERLQKNGLKCKLLIVGGNKSPTVEEDVRQLFAKFDDRVTFTGFQQGENLARQYASGDIFLHCSITETFGLVNLEAMASGLPVVARDEGGPSEIIVDQKTGYLIPPHDLESFVAHVELLARNPELRAVMSTNARQVALDTTWKKINNRVAVQLAAALEHNPEANHRPIRSWILKHVLAISSSFVVIMRINAAIGIIAFMWLVAVVPLLIHGNSKFPTLRSRVSNLSTWTALGDTVSRWLQGRAPGNGH
ncbi:glycosyltransferase family 4 protein [Viridothelium virens]|uniref:Glycosyltransferase family 4 protein n=1 Tax=Viridothelium virens TaxID=1048519 RepID=A0A6A6HKE7_VIRVR|nr:glycosyltransferase family 4 protein [Viridothelium virens]